MNTADWILLGSRINTCRTPDNWRGLGPPYTVELTMHYVYGKRPLVPWHVKCEILHYINQKVTGLSLLISHNGLFLALQSIMGASVICT